MYFTAVYRQTMAVSDLRLADKTKATQNRWPRLLAPARFHERLLEQIVDSEH